MARWPSLPIQSFPHHQHEHFLSQRYDFTVMAQLKSYIQFLGSATGDTGPTILLWFDKKRYIFNCSEGAQRFCSENHIKPSKLETFFFSRVAWENFGGLAGAFSTLRLTSDFWLTASHLRVLTLLF